MFTMNWSPDEITARLSGKNGREERFALDVDLGATIFLSPRQAWGIYKQLEEGLRNVHIYENEDGDTPETQTAISEIIAWRTK